MLLPDEVHSTQTTRDRLADVLDSVNTGRSWVFGGRAADAVMVHWTVFERLVTDALALDLNAHPELDRRLSHPSGPAAVPLAEVAHWLGTASDDPTPVNLWPTAWTT